MLSNGSEEGNENNGSFEFNAQAEIMDFSNQGIEDLEPLIDIVFAKMPNLKELNLASNHISAIPPQFWMCVPKLESINLNNNQIPQEQEYFAQVVQ